MPSQCWSSLSKGLHFQFPTVFGEPPFVPFFHTNVAPFVTGAFIKSAILNAASGQHLRNALTLLEFAIKRPNCIFPPFSMNHSASHFPRQSRPLKTGPFLKSPFSNTVSGQHLTNTTAMLVLTTTRIHFQFPTVFGEPFVTGPFLKSITLNAGSGQCLRRALVMSEFTIDRKTFSFLDVFSEPRFFPFISS